MIDQKCTKLLQFTCRRLCPYCYVLWCHSSYNGPINRTYQWVPHQPSCHSWPFGWPKNWSDQSHSLHRVSVYRCRNWHRTPFGKFNALHSKEGSNWGHGLSAAFRKHWGNKIEGTPILKLAMVNKNLLKKIIKPSRNLSKHSSTKFINKIRQNICLKSHQYHSYQNFFLMLKSLKASKSRQQISSPDTQKYT